MGQLNDKVVLLQAQHAGDDGRHPGRSPLAPRLRLNLPNATSTDIEPESQRAVRR